MQKHWLGAASSDELAIHCTVQRRDIAHCSQVSAFSSTRLTNLRPERLYPVVPASPNLKGVSSSPDAGKCNTPATAISLGQHAALSPAEHKAKADWSKRLYQPSFQPSMCVKPLLILAQEPGSHSEIWKYCQSTAKV